MPHGWKYIMDTTTETRIYNIARRAYLDGYSEWEDKPNVEYIGKKVFIHKAGRKKRKWLKPRTLEKLPPPIPNGTHVLIKNPWLHQWFVYPSTPGDFSEQDVVGIIKGTLPPAEIYSHWRHNYIEVPRYPGKYFTRERKYRIEPIVGSSKGRILTYPGDKVTIVSPADLPHLLFVMHIQAMNGQL